MHIAHNVNPAFFLVKLISSPRESGENRFHAGCFSFRVQLTTVLVKSDFRFISLFSEIGLKSDGFRQDSYPVFYISAL